MTTHVPVQAPPVAGQVVLYQPGPVHSQSSLNRKAALITGYIQIGLAVVSLSFGVACIFSEYFLVVLAIPVWAALAFYLVAGILGVIAGQSNGRNSCAIVGCLVMSVLAAVTASVHIVIGGFSAAVGLYFDDHYFERDEWYVVNILSVLVGAAELVTAIVSSAFMCCGMNCCCEQQTPNVVGQQQYSSYAVQPGQTVNQDQVGVQGYPMMQQQVVGQASGQLPAYTEHEAKEAPQV